MNKFIITTLAAISLSATPALANDRQHGSRGNDTGLLIFGGIVVAALLLSDRDDSRDNDQYEDRYERASRYDHRGRYMKSRRARAERYQYCDDVSYRDRYGTWQTRRICD